MLLQSRNTEYSAASFERRVFRSVPMGVGSFEEQKTRSGGGFAMFGRSPTGGLSFQATRTSSSFPR